MFISTRREEVDESCPIEAVISVLPPAESRSSCIDHHQRRPFKPPFWHRSSVQMAAYIVFCFCTLGPYNGLNALGGGGLKDHLLATKMNTLYALTLAAVGWLGGAAFNYYGCRVVSFIASLCFMTYVIVLLAITFFDMSEMWVYPVGVLLGLGAALLWASFGAVSIRYPVLRHQPRNFAVMWCLTNLGGFSCGLLSLVINFRGAAQVQSEANIVSYLVLLTLACVGCVTALVALRNQDTVFRSDLVVAGSSSDHPGMLDTLKSALRTFQDRQLMLLWPIFLAPFAHLPFLFNGLNAQMFNIRSRSLNSSLYWLSRIPGGLIFFVIAKAPRETSDIRLKDCMARRLMPGLYCTFVWAAFCLTFSHFSIFDSFSTYPDSDTTLDFIADFPRSFLPIIPFVTFGMLDALVQSFLYNLLGFLAGDDPKQAALCSGFYKTFQSMTVGILWALDWGLDRHHQPSLRYQLHWWIMCIIWSMAFPGTLRALLKLRKMPHHDNSDSGNITTATIDKIDLDSLRGAFPLRQVTRPTALKKLIS